MAGSCDLGHEGGEGGLRADGGGAEAGRHPAGGARHVRHGRVGQAEEVMRNHQSNNNM